MGVSGFPELIGEREQQNDERRLIGGIDRQDVETDALGLARFVEEAIALGFGESGIDGVARERFELSASAAAEKHRRGAPERSNAP